MTNHPEKPGRRRRAVGAERERTERNRKEYPKQGKYGDRCRRAEPAPPQSIVMMIMMMQTPHQREEGDDEHHAQEEQGALWLGQLHAAEGL